MGHSPDRHVRVRFAPSPTGHLHIGGLRTALFNWLFAKHNKGTFLLRIEDTDRERSLPKYTDSILASLAWVDIAPDEPIIIQSKRIAAHVQIAENLIAHNKAYRCICTQEEVLARYVSQGGQAINVQYDGLCRNKSIDSKAPHVIRFKIPDATNDVVFDDMIRGTITVPRDQLDDFIIVRSDGMPMYNFVVVADDAYMRISHVIRGEDHIINTPKQILLYQALGYAVPIFAHIPLVLGPSGQKLSKREAATSAIEYKKAGFFPAALINYLARLGWAHGDQEHFTQAELIAYFDLAHVSKSGAIFDTEKLEWLNSVYLRAASDEELYNLITNEYGPWHHAEVMPLLALYKERVKTLKDLFDIVQNTINGPSEYHDLVLQPLRTEETTVRLRRLIILLEKVDTWDVETLTLNIKAYAKELGIKIAELMHPLRVALIGDSSGPGVFALLTILGKKESLARLMRLSDTIERMADAGL
jgi:glutamyl-tRNA synthetase